MTGYSPQTRDQPSQERIINPWKDWLFQTAPHLQTPIFRCMRLDTKTLLCCEAAAQCFDDFMTSRAKQLQPVKALAATTFAFSVLHYVGWGQIGRKVKDKMFPNNYLSELYRGIKVTHSFIQSINDLSR